MTLLHHPSHRLSFTMMSSVSSPSPSPSSSTPLESNTAHIRHAALTALESLLHRESHPIYTCGRAYLENLARWRDRLSCESPKKKARNEDEPGDGAAGFSSSTDSSKKCPQTPPDRPASGENRLASPSQCPHTLISWRALTVEWVFDMADSLGFERNTAVAAVGYLDVYSMYCLFPDEFARRTAATHGVESESDRDFFSIHDRHGAISGRMYCLAATASFYTASKFYQTCPNIFTLSHASTLSNFSAPDIEDMERAIVKTLTFHLNPATAAKFKEEMLTLLLDHEDTVCETGAIDPRGNVVVKKRKNAALGTFRSTAWFPQTVVETTIYSQAGYLADLVAYTCAFPSVSSALPSKVALAAIVEAASENYKMGEDQIAFQDRLEELAGLNMAFVYDDEIAEIRKCIRWLLHQNGDREAMKEMIGVSPVTIVEMDSSPAKKRDSTSLDEESVHSPVRKLSPSKKLEASSSSASIDSMSCEINRKELKPMKHKAFALSNAIKSNTATNDGTSKSRVWEHLGGPHLLDASDRSSCSAHVHLFDCEKPKTTKRVSDVVF